MLMPSGEILRKSGIIGWPVDHSLSPVLHTFWLKQYNVNGSYQKLAVKPEELPGVFDLLGSHKFCGANVTIPYKERIIPYLDGLDETAKSIGAVNTIVKEAGKWIGYNTDCYGFSRHLILSQPNIKKEKALILGAGGAARAAVKALQELGFEGVLICNRTQEKSEKIAEDFGVETVRWDHRQQEISKVDILVNTTSLGMKDSAELDLNLGKLPAHTVVYDIVYNPQETPLLVQAKKRENPTVGGLGMLMHQAIPAFEKWFGVTPQVDNNLRKHMQAQL